MRWAKSHMRNRYHEPSTTVNSICLPRAMFACAVEDGLMGRNLKPSVRESSRLDLVLGVHQNIVYLAALFADKVLVALDQRSIGLLPQLTKHFHIIDSRPTLIVCRSAVRV